MRKGVVLSIFFSFVVTVTLAATPAREHFEQGLALFERGMWSAARQEFLEARADIHSPQHPLALRCEAMLALTAAASEQPDAQALLEDFRVRHPHTIYRDAIEFALADQYYRREEWNTALSLLERVRPMRLRSGQRDEYRFKLGYTRFRAGDSQSAYAALERVERLSPYGPPAVYYMAYIDYLSGRMEAAKSGFSSLAENISYGRLVPYYLLQIEFMEGNYAYVTEHGPALAETATESRAREISHVLAESWYHMQGHDQVLEALRLYRSLGGMMGREESYIEGYSYYMTGRYAEAAEALGAACGPEDALAQNASYHLADCYLRLGDRQRAMHSFSIAAQGRFDEAIAEDALFNYGKLQYDLGEGIFNEAINVLTRYVATYPSSPRVDEARGYLLAAYYNSRNYEAAWEAISQIPNPDNNVRAALQKITYFRGLEHFAAGELEEADRLLRISSENQYNAKYSALALYWRAEVAYRRGDYAAAIPLYRQYVTLSPRGEREHAAAHYALGYSYFNLQQWSSSREWFTSFGALMSAVQLGVEYRADALCRLGDAYHAERNYWSSVEQYDNAVRLGTEQQYYAQFRRAVVLGALDRVPAKIEALQAIINAETGDYVDDALWELGRTRINQQLFAEANELLLRYLRDYPHSPYRVEVLSDQALVAQNMGYSDRALGYYKQVVTAAPGTALARDAIMGIRTIYVELGDVNEYFAYAESVGAESDLGMLERDSITYAAAERIYLSNTQPQRAAQAMREYLDGYPKGTYRFAALQALADCALRSGDRAASKSSYAELAAMPENEQTARALEALARMQEEDKQFAEALESYRKLSQTRTAITPAIVNRALEGMVRTGMQAEEADMLAVTREVLDTPDVGEQAARLARFAQAETLFEQGAGDQAYPIYAELSAETRSLEGAKSAYFMIENCVAEERADEARMRIFAFAEQNSPHTYWLGRAFLMLGDIYLAEGDTFQARATWQSIVDGYTIPGDGIIEAAREKIGSL